MAILPLLFMSYASSFYRGDSNKSPNPSPTIDIQHVYMQMSNTSAVTLC